MVEIMHRLRGMLLTGESVCESTLEIKMGAHLCHLGHPQILQSVPMGLLMIGRLIKTVDESIVSQHVIELAVVQLFM